jgi:hypothetical protein
MRRFAAAFCSVAVGVEKRSHRETDEEFRCFNCVRSIRLAVRV